MFRSAQHDMYGMLSRCPVGAEARNGTCFAALNTTGAGRRSATGDDAQTGGLGTPRRGRSTLAGFREGDLDRGVDRHDAGQLDGLEGGPVARRTVDQADGADLLEPLPQPDHRGDAG